MDLIAMAEQVFPRTAEIAGNVKPDLYRNPTPCSDWDVHQLLNHMISTHHMFAALLKDQDPAEPLDEIGDDPGGAYDEAIAASLETWKMPGAFEQTLPLPIGATPGNVALALLVMDNIVHGWDLAQATGQHLPIDEDIAAYYLEQVRAMRLPRQPADGAPFGPEVPVPDSASSVDKLLGFLGRRP
jgi:uncharacterized protein (TIGR03086 family)